MNKEKLIKRIQQEEGLVLKPYLCPHGFLTIGYGRNLDAKGISRSEACMLLANDIADSITNCRREILYFDELSDNRQEALIDMCFCMGIAGLMKFKRMFLAIRNGDFVEAGAQIMDSKFWKDKATRLRAERDAKLMIEG